MAAEQPNPPRRYRYSDAPAATAVAAGAGAAGSDAVDAHADAVAVQPLLPLAANAEDWRGVIVAMVATAVGMAFLFGVNIEHLVQRWTQDAGWSHGFVVPLISFYFIRIKWEEIRRLRPKGSVFGLVVLLVAVIGQVLFRVTGVEHMSFAAMPLVLFGVVLFVLGWDYLKYLWLPIGFLIFALPPPQSLYVQLTTPMQTLAAELGANLLPLFGAEASRRGTVIDVTMGGVTRPLEIAQACSGMRLLVAFFALAVALGYSAQRPMWQKVMLAAFALPIAILCNGLRVTGTGILIAKVSDAWGHGDAHGFFGLLMLIPAMLLQLGVAWVLDRIFVETP